MKKLKHGKELRDLINAKLEEADNGTTENVAEEEGTVDDNNPDLAVNDNSDYEVDENSDTPVGDSEENSSEILENDTDAENGGEVDSPEGEFFEVKTADGIVRVTKDELINGFMRTADYTRKTQEVSRLRVEAEAILRNGSPVQPQRKPEVEIVDDFELDEYADETTKKLVEMRRNDARKMRELEIQIGELTKSSKTISGKAKLDALRKQFEHDEKLHGIPKQYFTPVAVYKRVGELLPDPNGVPYGDRYTLEMAVADVKGDIGDLLEAKKSVPSKGTDAYSKMEAEIIENYLKKKKNIGKATFSPSSGGSVNVPPTKKKFDTPKAALAYIKENV